MANPEVENHVSEPETTPDKMDAADYWRWQAQANAVIRLRSELRAVQAELRQLEPEAAKSERELFTRYQIGPGDSIDPDSMKITRVSR